MTSNDRARQDLNRMLTQWGIRTRIEYPYLVPSAGGGLKKISAVQYDGSQRYNGSITYGQRPPVDAVLIIYNRDLRESSGGDNGSPPQHTTEFVAALASAPADNGELTWESKRWRIVDCTKYGPLEDPVGYHGFLREIPKNG